MPARRGSTVYFIVTEALNNVVKHSHRDQYLRGARHLQSGPALRRAVGPIRCGEFSARPYSATSLPFMNGWMSQ